MDYKEIQCEREGAVCTLTLNNPAKINALSKNMVAELIQALSALSADEDAKELGLVNRAVPNENLDKETRKLAHQIVEASGLVIGMGKQAFYAQIDQADAAAWNYAKHTIALNNLAEDAQNGIKTFLNKEKAEWKNK